MAWLCWIKVPSLAIGVVYQPEAKAPLDCAQAQPPSGSCTQLLAVIPADSSNVVGSTRNLDDTYKHTVLGIFGIKVEPLAIRHMLPT